MADTIAPVRIRRQAVDGHPPELAMAVELDRWGLGMWGEVVGQHLVGDAVLTDVQPRSEGGRRALQAAVDRSPRHTIVAVDWGQP